MKQTDTAPQSDNSAYSAYLQEIFSTILEACEAEGMPAQYAQGGKDTKALDEKAAYIVREFLKAFTGGNHPAPLDAGDESAAQNITDFIIMMLKQPEKRDAILLKILDVFSGNVEPLQRGH